MSGHASTQETSYELVDRMVRTARQVLDQLVPAHSRVALVDFPNHNNSGDSAIWIGERAWLGEVAAKVAYTCDLHTYDRATLRRRLGDGIILVHGGGNLGDLWPVHQRFRERILRDHPDKRVIQLPQTVRFTDMRSAEAATDALRAHGAFTVLARDRRSQTLLRDALGLDSALCPDMAFFLGRLDRSTVPAVDVVWIRRRDREGDVPPPAPRECISLRVTDWLETEASSARLGRSLTVRVRRLVGHWASTASPQSLHGRLVRHAASVPFDWLASRRLAHAISILSKGRVVVTDRLHGHILCVLLDIPHVVVPDRHGKIDDFRATFTSNLKDCLVAQDGEAALKLARSLL